MSRIVDVGDQMLRPSPQRGLSGLGADARPAGRGRASACDGVGHSGLVGDRPTTENLTGDRMVGFEKLLFNGLCDKRFSHR